MKGQMQWEEEVVGIRKEQGETKEQEYKKGRQQQQRPALNSQRTECKL